MNRIGKFEKVSYDQFSEAMKDEFHSNDDDITHAYNTITLPARATAHSAGYDMIAPFDIHLAPGESVKVPTGIRVIMEPGWFLMCAPKSGLGFKYRARLANTVGIIDGDYCNSDNEGHIFCKLVNEGDAFLTIEAGRSFMQAIFIPYGVTYEDDVDAVRNGGFGSTG